MLLFPACSETEGPPDDQGIALYVEAYCRMMFSCDCTETVWSSEEVCQYRTSRSLRQPQLRARAAGLSYDEDCLHAHIEHVERTACEEFSREVCAYFHGDKAEGEPCTNHHPAGTGFNDCAPGLVCWGRCYDVENPAPDFSLEAGETCYEQDIGRLGICVNDLVCDVETTLRCTRRSALGEACTSPQLCAEGYCNGSICVPHKEDGEACTEWYECRTFCDEGVCVTHHDASICYGVIY